VNKWIIKKITISQVYIFVFKVIGQQPYKAVVQLFRNTTLLRSVSPCIELLGVVNLVQYEPDGPLYVSGQLYTNAFAEGWNFIYQFIFLLS